MSRVETISCGEELLDGRVQDTNGTYLAAHLAACGRRVARHTVVGDRAGEIAACACEALGRAGDVVLTGGLGPTDDDRTRKAAAEALGAPLELREELLDRIAQRLGRPAAELGERNRRQALLPAGACAIENPHGTAPGFCGEAGGGRLWCLPGVPGEMRPMFERDVLPSLAAGSARAPRAVSLHVTGLPESECDRRVAEALGAFGGVKHGITVRFGVITVALKAADAGAPLEAAAAAVREALVEHVFGEGGATLASAVVDELAARSLTLALAESCTGGLASARIVDVPGASRVLLESVVAYANEAKTRRLGVPAALIEVHGAVSEEVARAMAEGARASAGADLAAAVTGIAGPRAGVAGPEGGTPAKPVGRVWLAIASARGTRALTRDLSGGREAVRERSVTFLLDLVRHEALAFAEGKP